MGRNGINGSLRDGIFFAKLIPLITLCLQCLHTSTSVTTPSNDIFYFEIKENSQPNTYVGKIAVKAGFTYRFNDEPPEFELEPKTGVIVTTSVPTDRETKNFYNLVILSSSPTYPLEVKIKILDVNDNTPHWPSYINTNLSFSESAPIGTKVIVDTAIDPDEGHLHYQINVNENTDNTYITNTLPFRLSYNISSSFLHLEVSDKLDREALSSFVLNISAIDEGFKSSSVLFNVKILDSNDNPPIFDHSDYSVSLNESIGKDVSILQVRATDADEEGNENSRISYYLLSNEYFNIDPNTGIIYTAQEGPINCGTVTAETNIDYWKVCVFTVFAHDYGTPRQDGRTYVTAKIQDSNNHSPAIKFRYFSRSDHASVDENAANGSVVAAISVVDLDHGLNGMTTLDIADGDKYGHFRLDSIGDSHIIRVNGSLDREKTSSYNLTISACDQGSPIRSSSAYLIIVVHDHNDHSPTFGRDVFQVNLTESTQIGVYVSSLRATDLDEGINSNLFYSLSGPNSHYFKVDSITGLITTDKLINREEIDLFELRVTARDGGSNPKWAHALLKVRVLDINDEIPALELTNNAKFDNKTKSFSLEVEENSFLNITFKTIDNDLGMNGTVDLSLLYDYNGLFQMDESSRRLTSTKILDYEECDSFKLLIVAKDRGLPNHQLSSTTTIYIKVLDKDDISPVVYPKIYYSFVPLNQKTFNYSIVVSRVLVKDFDVQTPVNFIIHSYDELVPQMFALTRNGEIKLRNSPNLRLLNKDLPNFIKFNVGCNGCPKDFNDSQINIYLINSEMNSLSREVIKREYNFQIRENESIGSVVGRIDIDFHKYRLYLVSGDIYNHFVLIKNILKINKPIDREQRDSYRLQIIAANNQYFFHIDVNINVIDVNDCNPIFYEKFVEISLAEDSPPKFSLYKFKAIDPDSSNQLINTSFIEYKLISNPMDLFFIQNNELKLLKSLNNLIDRSMSRQSETMTIFRLEVIAIDKQLESNQTIINSYNSKKSEPIVRLFGNRKQQNFDNRLTLFVKIKSVNRYRPRFEKQFYEISISESTPVNQQFMRINAIDNDGDPIGLHIRHGNINNTFGIFPDGNLYIKNVLDRELLDVFSLRIDAFEISDGISDRHSNKDKDLSISCQVLIHIIDVNDNRPQFLNNTFIFTIPENSPINTLIGQVVAFDADIGSNSEIHYSLIKSYYSSYVEIDAFSGYIWSKRVLDRETLSSFEILVQAIDQPIDEDRFSSQALIRIDILDVNDNHPIFEVPINVSLRSKSNNDMSLSGDLLVSEDLKVDSTLATFKASDLDSDSKIVYQIVNSSHSHYFSLNDKTGILVLKKQLDRESIEQFELIIEANDGHFRTHLELNIVVEDVNDCPPVWVNFTHNQISLPENISIGSEIMKLNAFDADIGVNGLFRFEIQSSGNKKYFDILKQSLVVVNKLDFETERVHHLNLSAIDEMGLKSEIQVLKVVIEDVNDCWPVFSQRTDSEVIRVSENIEIGAKLVTLQAFDCDAGDVLTYEIVSCDTHYQTRRKSLHSKQNIEIRHKYDSNNCALKIDAKNGEIININSLDRELIESINLKVNVRDSVGHSDKKKLIFLIDDINDEKPFFISPNKIIIKQDSNHEIQPIGQIEAIDLDIGVNSVITYKMQSNQFSNYLSLDSQTGVLTTRRGFDTINKKRFQINVLATDGSGLSTADNITFIILADNLSDLNCSTKTLAFDIFENEPLGSQIAKLECSTQHTKHYKSFNSSHVLNVCEYHIVNSTDRTFGVDSQTGAVYIDALIDREVRDNYSLQVLVISKHSLEKIQVLFNILDQNDNPPYLKNTSVFVHISESSVIDLEVFDLSKLIADEDTNNKFDFQIINCSHCEEGVFLLNRKTGIITLKSRLDREKVSQYRILFGVSDGIYLLTSALDIFIDDENDNIPYFNSTLYTFEIEENTDRGVVVGHIFAFDEDISSRQLIYSIIDQNPTNSVFSLDARNGQFTLTKHLDYETDPNQYSITCEASDGTFKSERVKVVFNLINIEDNAPIFDHNSYKIELYENVSISQVLCVSATDADSFGSTEENVKKSSKLNYYFDSDSHKRKTRFENFEIDSKSGCIAIREELDRESKSLYELLVMADDGTFKASANVQIKVLDVNDNYPVFDANTPRIVKIYENSAIDTIVYAFKAHDLDEAPNNYIQYELIYRQSSYNSDTFPFSIGPIDGLLKISGQIDKEVTDSFDITIKANDYGLKSSEIEVTVEVIDVIDNAPQFEQTEFETNVFENATIDDIVIRLRATDLDQTDRIYYKIISGDIYGHFKVNDEYIVIAMQLDFEQINSFDLKINAIDNAGNSDTANVRINVINVLDESPYFFNSPYLINWCENEIGIIGQFQAILEKFDTNQQNFNNNNNNRVNYLLINNYEQYFQLNSTNAVLSVVKPIDREIFRDKPEIELRMIAIDSRSPRLTGEGLIHLTIFDVNDNEPYFSQSEYEISLTENQIYDINKPIGAVFAFDNDSDDSIAYHIIADSSDRFRVNESTGQIFLKIHSAFDREVQNRYDFKIRATDSKFETFTNLIINIKDMNDCSPKIISVNNEKVIDSSKIDISLPFSKLNSILQKDFILFGLKSFDCDMNGNKNSEMRFKLNTSSSSYLKINENNGVIKADQRITQIINHLKIEIIVYDLSETNPLSSSLNINFKIINDNQYRESVLLKPLPLTISVSESAKLNETIYNFETIIDNIEIVLIGGDPTDYFYVDNNQLKITKYLDFETIKEYNLFFEANKIFKDHKEFQHFKLDLRLINENDLPPKFDYDLYNATIVEEVDETILVTQVIATDIESDGTNSEVIRYKIISPTNAPFKIDERLGKIWTVSRIDREINSEFNLIVSAEDEGGLSSTCKVHITIIDKNDNPPRFTRLFRANITENASIGTFVIQVTSSDKDVGVYSRATYNFLSPSDRFDIDPYSGKVFVTGNLDRELKEEYLLSVSANDGSWRAQTTLTINILDENDSVPKFEKPIYEFHKTLASENNASLTIGTVKAWDADKGNNAVITYNLKHKSQYFSIDSQMGEISIKQLPKPFYNSDLTFLNRHTLTILATDKGQIPKTCEVNVYINILPNKIFKEDKLKANHIKLAVPYDLKNSTVLLTLESSIKSDKSQSNIITIDSNRLIFVGESVVRIGDNYKLTVISNSDKLQIDIYITEANSFAPEFISNLKQVMIDENQTINQTIFDGKAIDNDSDHFNNRVIYEFNVTKVIWNNKALDYIKKVYAKHSNNLFEEQTPIQNMVQNIQQIQYIGNPFAINSLNGWVYLTNKLNYELITGYTIKITASDSGWFTKNSSHDLDVIVNDVNDVTEAIGSDSLDSDLVTSSISPDPMSIGVILVITFFLILILVISTSFLIFHNQKKNQLRDCNTNQRKMTATIKPYLTTTPSPPSTLVQPQSSISNQTTSVHGIPPRLPSKQPDVVSPIVVPPVERPRPVPPAVPASIMHSHSDNYNDNYSNILATAEHYDLENASSIAPSDIDIVYHYKGFRNRDSLPLHHRHAPLARLSPSVSELSSMPRILTLQDLSPQVPPCPPVNNRTNKPKQNDNSNEEEEEEEEEEDEDNNTDDSFTCSEFDETNYELNKKDKNMIFQRVW